MHVAATMTEAFAVVADAKEMSHKRMILMVVATGALVIDMFLQYDLVPHKADTFHDTVLNDKIYHDQTEEDDSCFDKIIVDGSLSRFFF